MDVQRHVELHAKVLPTRLSPFSVMFSKSARYQPLNNAHNVHFFSQVVGEVKYKGFIDATVQIVKRKGIVSGLYAGLSAAYLRQWTYGQCAPRSNDHKHENLA